MDKKLISIITVNWNTHYDTLDFLHSLKKISIPAGFRLEKVVVDNGSTDNSVTLILTKFPQINLLTAKTNLGFVGGYNLGIKHALKKGAAYLMIINNDTLFKDSQILEKLVKIFKKNPRAGLVAPKIYFAPGFEFHQKRYSHSQRGKVIWYGGGIIDWENILFSHRGVDEVDEKRYSQVEETAFCTGCALFTKAAVLKKVGLFDPQFFAYLEDADLNMRVKQAGYKLIYAGNTSIWHKTSRSSGGSGSPFHDYFITRNRLIFGRRYASPRTKVALIREAIKLCFRGRKYQKLGIYDYFTGQKGKGRFFKYYKS